MAIGARAHRIWLSRRYRRISCARRLGYDDPFVGGVRRLCRRTPPTLLGPSLVGGVQPFVYHVAPARAKRYTKKMAKALPATVLIVSKALAPIQGAIHVENAPSRFAGLA